ncbi:MAG: PAS domain S-box protein [Ignavibacteria bacterium]
MNTVKLFITIEMALYKYGMEKKLKESEHWLNAALQSIGDALIATDTTGIIKIINPIAEEITGWQSEDAIGLNIHDVFKVKNEDDENLIENPVEISLKNDSISGETNKLLISKTGLILNIDYSSAPIKNESGKTSGFVFVFRDVIERVKCKKLIENQKKFLKQIIDSDPNYISVKNSEGMFELANKAAAAALGTTTEEIIGKFDSEYFDSKEIENQRAMEKKVINSQEEVFIPEEKFIDSKGKIHLLETFKSAVESRNGKEKLVLTVASDVTQLKFTERALRASEERIKTLLEAIPDIVLRCNECGILLDYHAQARDILLRKTGDVIGKNIFEIFEHDFAEKIFSFSKKASSSGEIQIFDYESGDEFPSIYQVRIFSNAKYEFITILRDITKIKLAENESHNYLKELQVNKNILEQKAADLTELNKKLNQSEQELIALNAAKDKFFSIIAHDLRSPFNSLLGITECLYNEIDYVSKEEIKSILMDIHKSAKSTFNLLENLLQWAAIKTKKIIYDPKILELDKLIPGIAELYSGIASNKEINLSSNINPAVTAYGDYNMISFILRNLISNAVKFTKPGGTINVSALEEKKYVKISVYDSGVGMTAEKILELFKLDKNISTPGTCNEKGSGLGLILCREFIEINKGKITVQSKIGEGSIFSFTLPKMKL